MKIFYSWQSDLNHDTHMGFIRKALQEAIKQAGSALDLEEAARPTLDEGTKNTRGAVNIVSTILDKIAASAVYVADVTPIAVSEKDKLLPNPNVLYEMGWASAKPGYDRVIIVMNDAAGHQIKDVPFDICQRNIITYSLKSNPTERQREKAFDRLVEELSAAIQVIFAGHIKQFDKEASIEGHPSTGTDFSIWTHGPLITHSFHGQNRKVIIPPGPRAYMRIIPAGWNGAPPSPDVFVKAPAHLRPEPVARAARSGSNARCTEGALRYCMTEPSTQDADTSGDLAVYFESTGEIWVLIASLWRNSKGSLVLDLSYTLRGWRNALATSIAFMDEHGAKRLRKVDAGINGFMDAYVPTGYSQAKQSLKPLVRLTEQTSEWDDDTQVRFRLALLNKIRAAIALPDASFDDLKSHEGQ